MSKLLKFDDHKERRLSARVTPDPFLIIRLPAGNQGVVLDVSHEGVGFLASAPVEEAQTIRFEISPRTARGSEATGQLMWKDRAGTRGGLRFTHLPEDLQAIILTSIPHERSQPALSLKPNALGSEAPKLEESEGTLPLVSQVKSPAWRFAANSLTTALACLIVIAVWYSVDRRDALDVLSHLKRQMPALSSTHMDRVPHWWTALVNSPRSSTAKPSAAKDPVTPSVASSTSVGVALSDETLSGIAPPEGVAAPDRALPDKDQRAATEITAMPKTDAVEATTTEERSSAPPLPILKDQGQTQVALARTLLQDDSDPANQAKAVQLLWQAVEKKNLAAEIELAGVYLDGRAVTKSCSQATVLLTAARSHKNALAEQKLRDMPQYGCDSPDGAPSPQSNKNPDSTQ